MVDTAAAPDDIAYVRRLAESGARAPLIGGRFMAWWGLLVTAAWTAHHFALHGAFGDGGMKFGIIWMIFGIGGGIGQAVLGYSMPAKSGAGSAGNLAARAAWYAAAGAILSMVIGAAVAAQTGQGYATFDWIAPVAFAVYASAQIVSGSLAGNRTVTGAGMVAVVMVGLFTAMIQHPDRYLVAAAGAALSILIPGLLLMRAEPGARGEAP
jgi:hypothetical protein